MDKPADEDTISIQIPGVNTNVGLVLYGDETDIYIAVLRAYIPNALAVIEKMRNVSMETLAEYTISVHGLKGISAGIAAEKVKEAAQKLEHMARSGDLEGVLEGNEALIKDAENIVSNIKAWLDKLDSQNPKSLLPYPDRALLARLGDCCEAYNMNCIDEVMDELEGANYENDASLVTWLRKKIDEMDLKSIVSRLSEYKEE